MTTENNKKGGVEIAGVVFTKTQDMINTTIDMNITNTFSKLDIMVAFAVNATGRLSFKNIIIIGSLRENSFDNNISSSYRINVLFHSLKDMSLNIDNLVIWDSYIYNYNDGIYNSFGIGLATNCIF